MSATLRRLSSIVAFACLWVASPAHAQETVRISLESAIDLAQQKSPAAAIAKSGYESAEWSHKAFEAKYLPSLSFFGTAPGFDRSITELQLDDGTYRYVPQSSTLSYGRLSLQQTIPLTNARISLQSGLSRIDQYGTNRFYQWRSSPLILELNQPLFQFNDARWERELAPMQFEAARREYQEELAQIAVDIADLYFDVYIAQMNVDNITYNVAFNDTTYVISQGRYDLGKIAENELLESELQLLNARSALSEAQINLERALQRLKVQLDLPYDTAVEIIPPQDVPDFAVDPTLAVQMARENRSAFLYQELQTRQSERDVAVARRRNGPTADLTARYGLNQSSDVFASAYAHPLDQQSLGVMFRLPLFQWGRQRSELQSAIAQRDEVARSVELRRAELDQEVYFLALQVRHLQQQAELAAKADTIAARRFEVARNRYTIGKIDIRDLFIAQQAKDSARASYYRTLHQFWQAYFSLRRYTLYDFVVDRHLHEIG